MALLTEAESAMAQQVLLDSVTLAPFSDSIVYGWCLKIDPDRKVGGPCFDRSKLQRIGWHVSISTAVLLKRAMDALGDTPALHVLSPDEFALPHIPAASYDEIAVTTPALAEIVDSLLADGHPGLPLSSSFSVD